MKKEEESKIKSLITVIIALLFIMLLAIVYIFFSSRNTFNIQIFNPNTQADTKAAPSKLNWYDNFKGVDNMKSNKKPVEKEKERPRNFLEYESTKNK